MIEIDLYHIDVENERFVFVRTLNNYVGLTYNKIRNGVGYGSFQINVNDWDLKLSYFDPFRSVAVVRDNDTVVWAGVVIYWRGSYKDIDGYITVEMREYLYQLSGRFTDAVKQFISTDAGDIAWNTINDVQGRTNGWLGINKGTIETTQDRDRTYEYKNVLDLIVDMSNVVNGFDFDLDTVVDSDNRLTGFNFNVYKNKGRALSDKLLGERGVQVYEIATYGNIVNHVTMLGAGTGDNVMTYSTSDDTSMKGYTRREGVEKRADVSVLSTLESLGGEELRRGKSINYVVRLGMAHGSDADRIGVDVHDYIFVGGYLGKIYFKENLFVRKIEYEVDNTGIAHKFLELATW